MWKYEELKEVVKKIGITTSHQYANKYSSYGWPFYQTIQKMPEWEGWDEFLGREIMTYDKLKDAVKDVGITSSLDYRNNAPKNGWPSNQTLTTMPEWEGWDKFLDREPKKEWTYEELKLAIRKVGVKSSKKYQNMTPSRGWPAVDTLRNLPEWEGWDEFLGRKK